MEDDIKKEDEIKKSELENQILELNKLVIFKYRGTKLSMKQKWQYNQFGWYADSIGDALWETNQKLSVILDELASQNKKLKEKMVNADSVINVLTENVRNLNSEREALLSRIDSLEQSSAAMQSYIDSLISRVTDIEKREEWVRERFDECNNRLDSCDKRFDEHNSRLDSCDKRFDEHNSRLDSCDKRFDENNMRFDKHDKRLDENNSRLDNHDMRLDENNARFDLHDRRLDENNTRFDFHDNRLDQLYNKLSRLSSENENSFSQSGEDMICEYVLRFLKTDISNIKYLDLGANHAKELSNTYKFYQQGGKGVLVEANPELIDELKAIRGDDVILNRAIVSADMQKDTVDFYVLSGDGLSTVDYEEVLQVCKANPSISVKQTYVVKTIAVSDIIKQYFPNGMDILNIDLEGMEYSILKEFDFSEVRPKIIILESIEYKPYLVMKKQENPEINDLLKVKGYIEYAFTGINSIYLDKKFADKINSEIVDKLDNDKGEK